MTRLAPILFSVLALAVASCGGGDEAPSQEEFADRANEICREAEQAFDNVGENAETPQDIIDAVNRVIEDTRGVVDELADLERPEGEAGQAAEEFVETTRSDVEDQGIPALEELRDAIETGDQQAVTEAAQRLQQVDSGDSDRAARRVGADQCADG
jgi:hypothetical protein